jgi:hypothetical protein
MHPQPIKVLADGTQLEPGSDRTDHVAVLFQDSGLMIHTASLGDAKELPNWDACGAACSALRVLGHDDWKLASRQHWERHMLDLDRYNPAVDPSLFPGIKPGWHWTSTGCAWNRDAAGVSPDAWLVRAGLGLVLCNPRGGAGFALAVRRVGQ